MYQLLCSTYNKTEQGLVLRNTWMEAVPVSIEESVNSLSYDIDIMPSFDNIRELGIIPQPIIGQFKLDNTEIHIYVVKLS